MPSRASQRQLPDGHHFPLNPDLVIRLQDTIAIKEKDSIPIALNKDGNHLTDTPGGNSALFTYYHTRHMRASGRAII